MSLYRMSSELSRKEKRVLVSILQSLQQYGTLSKTVLFKIFVLCFYMDRKFGVWRCNRKSTILCM